MTADDKHRVHYIHGGLHLSKINLPQRALPPKVPAPSHRHGTPSGPWPFLDLGDEPAYDPDMFQKKTSSAVTCGHGDPTTCRGCWRSYPQGQFSNWTKLQQQKSKIGKLIDRPATGRCTILTVDALKDGSIVRPEQHTIDDPSEEDTFWEKFMRKRPKDTHTRAWFLDNLSGPVLQMFGTKYRIEPFFFSSSLRWIPARYQEEVERNLSDHVTIVLTFMRSMRNPNSILPSPNTSYSDTSSISTQSSESLLTDDEPLIDTQMPLTLNSNDRLLFVDILAVHLIRAPGGSTLISYHPGAEHKSTSAQTLQRRMLSAGQSVYWHNIMSKVKDPSFLLIVLLWFALYAWDEALEMLYVHICHLESRVISTNDMHPTRELHIIRAHLLHYEAMLDDFRKTVEFVQQTPYPALANSKRYTADERSESALLMGKESERLLSEIGRLEKSRQMQDNRLKNVMDLGFSLVNLADSRRMAKLTIASSRDSAAMKQIAYLTMLFLPATFVATAFGMNIEDLAKDTGGTLAHYFEAALPLTFLTIWLMLAFQYERRDADGNLEDVSLWERMMWPVVSIFWWVPIPVAEWRRRGMPLYATQQR